MKRHWDSGINYLLAWDRGMNFDNSKLVHYILIGKIHIFWEQNWFIILRLSGILVA